MRGVSEGVLDGKHHDGATPGDTTGLERVTSWPLDYLMIAKSGWAFSNYLNNDL